MKVVMVMVVMIMSMRIVMIVMKVGLKLTDSELIVGLD